MSDRRLGAPVSILAVVLAVYCFAGKLGLHFAFVRASASPVRPPTGIDPDDLVDLIASLLRP